MTTPAYRLSLEDRSTLRLSLADRATLALALENRSRLRLALEDRAALSLALEDRATLRLALEDRGVPELGVGAVYVVSGRLPMLTTAGTPVAFSSTIEAGPLQFGAVAIIAAEPHRYVPGALRPQDAYGQTRDRIRVISDAGAVVDLVVIFSAALHAAAQALDVPIGTDGVAALYAGGALALTASGGTGPYVWDFVANRSGGTLTAGGAYVAGPAVGIDRARVTDSLGEVAYAQLEVVPGRVVADLTGMTPGAPTEFGVLGYQSVPYAQILGPGGVGISPYSIALQENQTGAVIEPSTPLRATFALELVPEVDVDEGDIANGPPADLAGWTFDAKVYSQRGGLMATGLSVSAAGNVVTVDLPEPSTLPLPVSVVRVTAITAGAIAALGYPTTSFELLLTSPEA